MLKYSTKKIIDVNDWDNLVEKTYGKTYCFQQQDGCQDRGIINLTIPTDYDNDDQMNDSIPEEINGEEMGVKFAVWLARDPKQLFANGIDGNYISMFWERNFYPELQTIANDMFKKGLIEAGNYCIDIDW